MIRIDPANPEDVALLLRVCPLRLRDLSTYIPESAPVRRVSGRHLIVEFVAVDADGGLLVVGDEFVSHRKRVSIPKGHPWRGRRAGAEARRA